MWCQQTKRFGGLVEETGQAGNGCGARASGKAVVGSVSVGGTERNNSVVCSEWLAKQAPAAESEPPAKKPSVVSAAEEQPAKQMITIILRCDIT